MLDKEQAWQVLRDADLICAETDVNVAVRRIADEIAAKLRDASPLVLSVMGGAVVFTGQLLPLLRFPIEFDYLHVTRYNGGTRGSEVQWKVKPRTEVNGRTVLVVDDILDEGETLASVRARLLGDGAQEVYCAVFADKDLGRAKPIRADFIGITVPDRYVFGFGMDINGSWRNLPAIYAIKS